MTNPCPRATAIDFLWLTACFCISALWCIGCALRIGPTFDEPTYLAEGLTGWRTWSHGGLMSLGTMPLAIDLQTLPLYLWETWRGSPIDFSSELHHVLPWARLMTLAFWAMLLTYALLIGRRVAGVWGGRIAVALVACEPNLLAHASLATTDLSLAACLLAALYHFERGRNSSRWTIRVGLPAICCAATVLAKASAIVFIPLCFAAIETAHLLASGAFRLPENATNKLFSRVFAVGRAYLPFVRDYAQIIPISTAIVLVYCGTDYRVEQDFVDWANELPPSATATAAVWFAEHLQIFPNAGEAFVRQVKHNLHGHPMYIAGVSGQRGVWYYFPLTMLIKLPLPLIGCVLMLPLIGRRHAWSWPLLCGALLLAYSFSFRVQIGVRMVLPIIVLLAIGAAIILVRLHDANRGWRRRAVAGVSLATVLGMIVSSASVWPHGLCYANVLAGGVDRGYTVVSDSNYDWGQGVPDLLRWREQNRVAQLDVWYFGCDPRASSAPLRNAPLHTQAVTTPDDLVQAVSGRYLAVGATIVHGGYVPAAGDAPGSSVVRFLRSQQPVARAGTFLIYDLAACPQWAQRETRDDSLARDIPETKPVHR